MNGWAVAIGLEVHVQLKTSTKIFCGCPVVPSSASHPPNAVSCPVCQGQPGVLPALNRRVKELALVCSLALNCKVNTVSAFERKHYYYPDLPKNFQITQNRVAIGVDGYLDVSHDDDSVTRVQIRKVHMEEDAAKLEHAPDGTTRVDFNRCGVPLLEIVTEANISSPAAATRYLQTLQHLLRWYGVSSANMELGEMRCDANISVRPETVLLADAVKWELKNLNSVRFVEEALSAAVDLQLFELEKKEHRGKRPWEVLNQATFGYLPASKSLKRQRVKEVPDEYFYFEEPDLMDVTVTGAEASSVRAAMPPAPAKASAMLLAVGLNRRQCGVVTMGKEVYDLFNRLAALVPAASPTLTAAIVEHGVLPLMRGHRPLPVPEALIVGVLDLAAEGIVPINKARPMLEYMAANAGVGARQAAVALGLLPAAEDDVELTAFTVQLLKNNPTAVRDYKQGKNVAGYFTGRVLREFTGPKPPARVVTAMVHELLRKAAEE